MSRHIVVPLYQHLDVPNQNGRVYTSRNLQKLLSEDAFEVRLRHGMVRGEFRDNPSGAANPFQIQLPNLCVRYDRLWVDGGRLMGKLTPAGPKADLIKSLVYGQDYTIAMRAAAYQPFNKHEPWQIINLISFDIVPKTS